MWKPEKYEMSSSAQKLWAEELIRKIEIGGRERVLDIGCGDGRITAGIADLVPKGSVLGIDSSREMVRFAIEKFLPEIRKNLRFAEADATGELGKARHGRFRGVVAGNQIVISASG